MAKSTSKSSVHVTKHSSGDWQAITGGKTKAAGVYPTQAQAIDKGKQMAKNQKTELAIHGTDGKIREKHSYGNDPFPPKG